MRILVDTNIIIPREDDSVVPSEVSAVLRLFADRGDVICVHPSSLDDLARDKDEQRKAITLSKVQSYPRIESPPDPTIDIDFRRLIGPPRDPNSEIDDRLLYSVLRNAVDLLITNDQGMHRKATLLSIDDRVLTVIEALVFLDRLRPDTTSRLAPPEVRLEPLHSIDLQEGFFDSLRQDYPGFDAWFTRKSRDGAKAWIHRIPSGQLGAFMLLKDETDHIDMVGRRLPWQRRIKISTLKVTRMGYRLGELLLKIAFEYALKNSITDLYLTLYPGNKDFLISLITAFGFKLVGQTDEGEEVYYKTTRPVEALQDLDPVEVFVTYYPCFVDSPAVAKFIVPIQPKYHDRLFPSWTGRQLTFDFEFEMFPEGNAIRKAYLCNSRTTGLAAGAVLLFYRSHDVSAVTTVGVIERVERGRLTVDKVLTIAGRRIVYTQEEIETILQKPALLILFRWHAHFPSPLNRGTLVALGALKGSPQSIVRITHESYILLKWKGELENCITVS